MNRYLITLLFIFSFGALKAQGTKPKDTLVVGKQAFCGIVFYVRTDTMARKDTLKNGKVSIWKHGLVCAMQDQSTGVPWKDSSFVTTKATTNVLFDIRNAWKVILRQGNAIMQPPFVKSTVPQLLVVIHLMIPAGIYLQ